LVIIHPLKLMLASSNYRKRVNSGVSTERFRPELRLNFFWSI